MSVSTFQTLWIGPCLKPLHVECLKSFLRSGHSIDLYVYEAVQEVPSGINLKDAHCILPSKSIFTYQKGPGKGSFSAFSNLFRYTLLFERGGIWIDTDVFCLRPWEIEKHPYLFASETLGIEQRRITASCVIKTPPQSEIMRYCQLQALQHSVKNLEWGQIGPVLLNHAVNKFELTQFIRPSWEFCALSWDEPELLLDPSSPWKPPKRASGLHLNHEILRRTKKDVAPEILGKLQKWTSH